MRRRPPAHAAFHAARLAGEARADQRVAEMAAVIRDADPVDAALPDRLDALERAAVQAAGGDAGNALAAVVAARQAAERVAGEEGADLRTRARVGDLIVGQLVRALRPAAPGARHH